MSHVTHIDESCHTRGCAMNLTAEYGNNAPACTTHPCACANYTHMRITHTYANYTHICRVTHTHMPYYTHVRITHTYVNPLNYRSLLQKSPIKETMHTYVNNAPARYYGMATISRPLKMTGLFCRI